MRQKVIDTIKNPSVRFNDKALLVYEFQYKYNSVYRQFVDYIKKNDFFPNDVHEIPFLPISLFKNQVIKTGVWKEELLFYSSGTTSHSRSVHYIRDREWYLGNCQFIWESIFNPIHEFNFISLLPNYHENPSSSLLNMVSYFMLSGLEKKEAFYLDTEELNQRLIGMLHQNERCVLFGVSFALLDYAQKHTHKNAANLIVVETGGMKKYAKEITREDLHNRLRECFCGAQIISEYGMTECLSQMYCSDGKHFDPNDRMQVIISDPTDPFECGWWEERGRINLIDLANYDSIAFIATDDLGINRAEGTEILGRLSNTDLRGCNYLI